MRTIEINLSSIPALEMQIDYGQPKALGFKKDTIV